MTSKTAGPAPTAVTLTVAGIEFPALARIKGAPRKATRTEFLATGQTELSERSWALMLTSNVEKWWEDEDGNDCSAIVTKFRGAVTVDAPAVTEDTMDGLTSWCDAAGKLHPFPTTAVVSCFGETKTVALVPFHRVAHVEKRDGKATGNLIPRSPIAYGTVEYHRAGGVVYVAAVRVIPSASGAKWKTSANIAQ